MRNINTEHWRFNRSATAIVVPQPQKKSATTSPSFVVADTNISKRISGF
jgi:hypothetical protein